MILLSQVTSTHIIVRFLHSNERYQFKDTYILFADDFTKKWVVI